MKRIILYTLSLGLLLCGCGNSNISSTTVVNSSGIQSSSTVEASSQSSEDVKIDVKKIIGSANTRSKVEFGAYWQEDTNKDGKCDKQDDKQPILWQIIDVDEAGDALLFADRILDSQPYNSEYVEVTWETCSLRKWLNGNNDGDFLKEAFNVDQQALIKEVTLENKDVEGADYNKEKNEYIPKICPGGNDTQDKIFLLSNDDVKNDKYKWGHEEPSPRLYSKMFFASPTGFSKEKEYCYMLRSPGQRNNLSSLIATYMLYAEGYGGGMVSVDGKTFIWDYENVSTPRGVRPAIWVNLKDAGLVDKILYEQAIEGAH